MEEIRSIRRDEVLRYLGYRGQPLSDDLLRDLDECESLILSHTRPAWLYRVFDRVDVPNGIGLSGSKLILTGADIAAHLAGCSKIVLLAATLSAEADRLITQSRIASMTRTLFLDAAADALIEQVCDAAEREIHAETPGMFATWRFSPGYGDLPITLQREILTVLDAQRRIGLCVTDSSLLTPRKSVTAILGLSDQALPQKQRGCETCMMREHCAYRKRGDRCVR